MRPTYCTVEMEGSRVHALSRVRVNVVSTMPSFTGIGDPTSQVACQVIRFIWLVTDGGIKDGASSNYSRAMDELQ